VAALKEATPQLSVQWFSTNEATGHFSAPGDYDFTAPGSTVIYAEGYRLSTTAAYAYSFGHDGIRQVSPFAVFHRLPSSNAFDSALLDARQTPSFSRCN
jgi:hypothetical protein